MGKDTLTITDNRTGTTYEVPVLYGVYPTYGAAIGAPELRQVKVSGDDFGLLRYDPGFLNTASCKSAITFIDGDRGSLRYRGYTIEELAEQSTYLETAYLCGTERRQFSRRPLLGGGGRHRGPRRPAPWGGQHGGAPHAGPDWIQGAGSGVHQGGEGGEGSAHGFWPPTRSLSKGSSGRWCGDPPMPSSSW